MNIPHRRFSIPFLSAILLSPGVAAAAQPSLVIVVRHAERATAPAGDPVLTATGMRRATDLASALAGARVTSTIATQFQRTQLTARPLAEAIGQTSIVVRAAGGAVQAHVDSVAAAVIRRPAGDVVLVVGHSNTVPAIIAALGGPKMPDLCDGQYSSLFILEYPADGRPRFIRASYGAPDPPGAESCHRPMR